MYAIVAASGKQFRVTEGDRIVVDRVSADVGETIRLESVLLLSGDQAPQVGKPFVSGAFLEATVLAHRAGDKIIVFRMKERKRFRRKVGHRQLLSELKIGAIHAPGVKETAEAEVAPQTAGTAVAEEVPAPRGRTKKPGQGSRKKTQE
jgi:large subunit ribosomal protein L21